MESGGGGELELIITIDFHASFSLKQTSPCWTKNLVHDQSIRWQAQVSTLIVLKEMREESRFNNEIVSELKNKIAMIK